MLIKGGACTQSIGIAENHYRDTSCGGSIHFQVRGARQTSYNRLFVAVDHEGEPFLFYDTIEANNIERSRVSQYVAENIADVLIGSITTSLAIAERMEVKYIAFGDYELVELMRDLGYGERVCFKKPQREKAGIRLNGESGISPKTWMIKGSSNFRTIETSAYAPSALDEMVEQASAVMQRLESHKKRARQAVLDHSKADFELYFALVEEALNYATATGIETAKGREMKTRLSSFYGQYGLTPNDLTPNLSLPPQPIEEPALPVINPGLAMISKEEFLERWDKQRAIIKIPSFGTYLVIL